jgi:ElaB/YqjD/DUF883 family membrane-anchored ribosome-binding protein
MDTTPEQVYTSLLRRLADPGTAQPEVLASLFREVERMHEIGHITDWQLQNAREAYARAPVGRIADAARRAADTATEAIRAGAGEIGERAATAAASYTRADPVRALLIAAGTGALLMVLVSMLARSGARKVRRTLQG